MKRKKKILLFCGLVLLVVGCSRVPLTGRKQLLLVSDAEVLSLSQQSYSQYMTTAKKSTNVQATQMVYRVGRRIAAAVETYLRNNGMENELKGFAWEFNLIQDATPNAFCMPGGKIVVYEGILPYTRDEEGLAIVLGHEVAHAVARHSAEQMSRQVLANVGGEAVGIATAGKSAAMQGLAQQVFGLGAQVGVMLPYSRKNESEADRIGLIFSAMAGYNPQAALGFWQRMAAMGSASSPEFLSTHPSDESRIKDLQKEIPKAMKYYKGTSSSTTTYKGIKGTVVPLNTIYK